MRNRKGYAGKLNNLLLLLLVLLLTSLFTGCGGSAGGDSAADNTKTAAETTAEQDYGETTAKQRYQETAARNVIDPEGAYYSRDDVAAYIHTYGKLPENYITKNEARDLGWQGGSLEKYAPGKCIGGDRFGNYEGQLPPGKYQECDVNTKGKKERGAERLIYSKEDIYYTGDHYRTFEQLYDKDGKL